MQRLFCDLRTDSEKADFFLNGEGFTSGVIAKSIQNDVSMAYRRCANYQAALDEVGKEAVWAMEHIKTAREIHYIALFEHRRGLADPVIVQELEVDDGYQRAQAFLDKYRTRQAGKGE